MADLELCYTPATELARRIRAREVSPVEVIDNLLARIEEVQPVANCFCFTYADEARDKARAAEAAVLAGDDLGALHGVPIAFKDLTPTAGKRTTMGGAAMFEDWVPDESAPVVTRLEDAGTIMIGKTTSPEFGYSGFTRSAMWGVTRNPWNPDYTPGGSSGGAAAAVASGCVPFAEGSDGGGSVRSPASFCGLVGLKPSVGRIPFKMKATTFEAFVHHGPLSRTVDDTAAFLAATLGPDERDMLSITTTIDVPVPVPPEISGMRLALSLDFGCYDIHPDIAANTRAAAQALADAGAEIEEVDLGWGADILEAFYTYWDTMYAADFGDALAEWGDRLDPQIVTATRRGQGISAVALRQVDRVRTEMWRKFQPVLERCDALLCPTSSMPVPLATLTDLDYDHPDEAGRLHGFMTYPFNMLSQCPALSVPSGFDSNGLPSGLQIVGRRFDDIAVLKIGAALEQARPWADKRPAI